MPLSLMARPRLWCDMTRDWIEEQHTVVVAVVSSLEKHVLASDQGISRSKPNAERILALTTV